LVIIVSVVAIETKVHGPAIGGGRVSRAELVAENLSERIIEGSFFAGQRLGTKTELREEYGVAVGTLNEAVRLLESRGLVNAKPGPQGGIFVAAPPAHIRLSHLILGLGKNALSVADSLEIRDALEAPIALHASRTASAADLKRLRKMAAQMGKCEDDPTSYLSRNWALHEAIAELSANRLLRTIYISLLDTARGGVRDVEPDEHFRAVWRENWRLHVDLVEAIACRDERRVVAAAEAHQPLSATLPSC
jgi:DNA-binding FadR family transcriptional regulator